MNITSLLITLAGIIIIIALYIMSRVTKSKLPQKNTYIIPELKDENGERFTSVLDDIPATDGSTPSPHQQTEAAAKKITPEKKPPKKSEKQKTTETTNEDKIQNILFISGKDNTNLDGNLVKQALEKNGLVLGDMDIYHYFIGSGTAQTSLVRVANGMEPWTLKNEDLHNKQLAGLSVVMITANKEENKKFIETFISIAEHLCHDLNAVLKNQQQQVFTQKDKELLLA